MKVIVDKNTCIGCGYCTGVASDVFSIDDDGLAKADNSKINDENMEDVTIAKDSCPVEAIKEEEM